MMLGLGGVGYQVPVSCSLQGIHAELASLAVRQATHSGTRLKVEAAQKSATSNSMQQAGLGMSSWAQLGNAAAV